MVDDHPFGLGLLERLADILKLLPRTGVEHNVDIGI